MRRLLAGALAVAVLLAPLVALAQIVTVRTIFSGVSAASGTSIEYSAAGPNTFNVQVCGTGLSGTVLVSQGAKTGKLGLTKTITLTSYTGCTEYYWFNPSALVQFGYTRSAGTLDTLTYEYFPK